MEKKTSYFKNAVILTGSGLILRFAGMCFRVYIAAELGGEGMGLYQLIFSLYNLSIAAATAGVSVASTRLVAEELSRQDDSAVQGVLKKVLSAAWWLGLGAGTIQFFTAVPAAQYWLGDIRAAASLRVLAPSLPFMAMAATLRGYFLGRRQTLPNAKSQLMEQAVRILFVVAMIRPALEQGPGRACAAVMLADTLSEVFSCLCMFHYYRKDRATLSTTVVRVPQDAAVRLRAILWPVEGNRCLASALQAAENMLVPACLTVFLGNRQQALGQYGALKGMAMPVLFFPFSFLTALSTLLMPEITQAHLEQQGKKLQYLVNRMMFLTMTVSMLMAGLCMLYAPELGTLLYQDAHVGGYIRVLAPLMPWMYLESMVDGVLKGMGQQMATFRYSVWDSMLRIGGVVFLLPKLGMSGFMLVMLVSNLFTCTLNTRRMLQSVQMRMHWCSWVLCPLMVLGISGSLSRSVMAVLPCGDGLLWLLLGAMIMASIYGILMLPFGLWKEIISILPKNKMSREA